MDDITARLAGDLEAAMIRTREARDEDEIRRSLYGTYSTLYAWREYEAERATIRLGREIRYIDQADADLGRYVEALVLLRHVLEHHHEQHVEPRNFEAFPAEDVYPSEWMYPGWNLCVVDWERLPPRIVAKAKPHERDNCRELVAGKALLPNLAVAAECLRALNH